MYNTIPMFTFYCTTCEAKLIVKDEKLTGKIVPCPKCGCMVLVPTPDDAPPPPHGTHRRPANAFKRFPDALTHETASGIIGQVPQENLRSGLLLDSDSQESTISDTEITARKVLVGILIGLLILLLLAFGFQMLFQQPTRLHPPEPPPPILPLPADPPPMPPVEREPAVSKEPMSEPPLNEEPMEILRQDTSAEPSTLGDEHLPTAADTLSTLGRKMPGLVETSVPNIDIAEKLTLPIREINLGQTRLIDFVRSISALTRIPITFDIDEMKPISLSVKTPVEGHFKDMTVGTILTDTLATVGLQWIAIDRQMLIVPKETADREDLTFDVSDFAVKTDDLNPEAIAEMIQKLVCPTDTVAVFPDGRLNVTKNNPDGKSLKRLKNDIVRFLEQLRVIRQLSQQTKMTGETLAPEAFGWDKVMEPITLNYYQAVPLSRVVEKLESMTPLTILIDHQSFHRALCPFASVQTAVQCDRGTVNDVLELSLASVDTVALTYRIIDSQTLEITTMESARRPDKMVVEVHRYQLNKDESAEDFVRSLRLAVAPGSWVTGLPETIEGGNMVIDRPSGYLLVRQSQPAQRQIRLYLATLEL